MDKRNNSSRLGAHSDLNQEEINAFDKILYNLYHDYGVDFRQYRHKCLRRRVTVRMHQHNIKSFVQYLSFLKKNPQECNKLIETITINVSEFFRNPETFQAVRTKVIPEIFERKKQIGAHIFRIWSAGCATGEEPYSIAIMLRELMAKEELKFNVHIIATDIDDDALAKARLGRYASSVLKVFKTKQLEKYFDREQDNFFIIKPELKEMIRFIHHNIISDKPHSKIDLIFCRNVVIYFNKMLQRKVYSNFHSALRRDGYLVAGKVETLLGIAEDLFERIDLIERIFKKK